MLIINLHEQLIMNTQHCSFVIVLNLDLVSHRIDTVALLYTTIISHGECITVYNKSLIFNVSDEDLRWSYTGQYGK